jgi:predicted Zn-dependent protease
MRRISLANSLLILSLSWTSSGVAQTARSSSDADINAIGHRSISRGPNFYSLEHEQELGNELASYIEKYNRFITDAKITGYVDRVARKVEQSSDKHMEIAVKLIDSDNAQSFTLPGGHIYITKGLLIRLENEGELASAIARGVAFSALRSWVKVGSHEPDLDADYFGMQYLYKAGYAFQCFLDFVERAGDSQPFLAGVDTDGFPPPSPPMAQRLQLLQKEIADIMPKQERAVVSTVEFREFKDRIQTLKPEIIPTVPTNKSQ